MTRNDVARLCFFGVLFIGLGCIFVCAQLDTIVPYFRLDVVLTPEELADDEITQRTLDYLRSAKSGHAPYWYATGIALVVLSGLGLWATWTPPHSPNVG